MCNPLGKVRLICISDTHGQHQSLQMPSEGDVLLVTGDFTALGPIKEVKEFNSWLGSLPYKHNIVIAGNHEKSLDGKSLEDRQKVLSNATVLHDSFCDVHGLKFYGTPWIQKQGGLLFFPIKTILSQPFPRLGIRGNGLAHTFAIGDAAITRKWNNIPSDTDVLLTHFPPHSILDGGVGSYELFENITARVRPLIHCYGHVHECRGIHERNGTTFVNAACWLERRPIQLDLDLSSRKVTLVEE